MTVPDTHHLQLRGGRWYFVRRVPLHLVAIHGGPIIKQSLQTSDKAAAKKLRSIKELEADALFAELEKQLGHAQAVPVSPKASTVAKLVGEDELLSYLRLQVEAETARTAAQYAADPPSSGDELLDMRVEVEQTLHELADPDSDHRRQMVAAFERAALKSAGEPVDASLPSEADELARRALIELYRRKLDRLNDDHSHTHHDGLFHPSKGASATTLAHLTKVHLSEKLADYGINGVSEKRADSLKAVLATLEEIIGAGALVSSINDDTVQAIRAAIAALPTNRTKLFPGLSALDSIEANKKEKRATLGVITQAQHLAIFKAVMATAVRKKMIPFNPAEGIKPLTKATILPHERRIPFSYAQLISFFTGKFYQSCAQGAADPYASSDREWRFWIPLIMLFSGARPNEIAQLTAANIGVSAGGRRYFDLTSGDTGIPAVKVKTGTSKRCVPIHPTLLNLGLLEHAQQRATKDGPAAALFPTLKPDKYGNLAHYASRRFNESFLPAAITMKPRQALYSLRHNARDALRKVGAPLEALLAIGGWAPPGGVAASFAYGDPTNPDFSAEWVDRIAYEGLDLSFLHVPDASGL